MSALSAASSAAIARLRSYVPPPTAWHALPVSRKAAVLILLFPDDHGNLRVVLTMRAATLKSYAGHAALPGGKADGPDESPLWCARREAFEEIGLPLPASDARSPTLDGENGSMAFDATKVSPPTPDLPYPFTIEHICQLPSHLAKTELGVRPCVAFLSASSSVDRLNRPTNIERMLVPQLDAKEVAAVFSAPLHNFLRVADEVAGEAADGRLDGQWYDGGTWTEWHEGRFRMHNFFVPVKNQVVARPQMHRSQARLTGEDLEPGTRHKATYPAVPPGASRLRYRDAPTAEAPDPLDGLDRFRVFGMTARILIDCARVAYGEEPEFEHNHHFGDEAVISKLHALGRMQRRRGHGDEFVAGENDIRAALALQRQQQLGENGRMGKL